MADGTAVPVTGPPADAADDADSPTARIGERLLSLGLLAPDQLHVALLEKNRSERRLGEILVGFGFITEAALSQALADSAGLQRFDPATAIVDPAVARAVPRDVAARHKVLPVSLSETERTLRVAMADVHDIMALDRSRRHFPAEFRIDGQQLRPRTGEFPRIEERVEARREQPRLFERSRELTPGCFNLFRSERHGGIGRVS